MTSEQSAERPGPQTVEDLFAPAPPRPDTLREPWETVPPGILHENGAEVPDLATVPGVTDRSGFATVYPGTDVLSPKNVTSPYDTVASPAVAAGKHTMVPGYEILRELGRGGMGVVYLARQLRPSRLVALKMVLTGAHAGTEELTRFRREIEAVASVSHPNLVPVYEVGEHEGRPYYAMQFVAGGSLAAWIGAKPQSPQAAAVLAEALARAVHAVHQRGIIHRDLKPANILLEEVATRDSDTAKDPSQDLAPQHPAPASRLPIPKIADFGLAKTLHDDASPTLSGSVLGTPSYMAPEQAAGKTREIDARTDVYALGAILYHMLTGRPPFQAETTWDTISQVKSDEPVAPRRLQPRVPVDIETICLKCLRKEPARRYASADELAADLARFLAGEPVQARPIGAWARAVKWARRRPAAAALVAVCLLTVAALGMGVLFHASQLRVALAQSEANAEEGHQRLIRLHVAQGTRLLDTGDGLAALPWFAEALHLSEGRPGEEDAHRIRMAVTLQHCPRLVHLWSHGTRLRLTAFSAAGHRILTAAEDGTAQVWATETGETMGPALAHGSPISAAAVSTEGDRVVTAGTDGTARIWEVATGRNVSCASRLGVPWTCVSFRADGQTVVAADAEGTIHVLDVHSGKPVMPSWRPGAEVGILAFNREGTRTLTVATDNSVRVWDTVSREAITPPLRHAGRVQRAVFAVDGSRIVTAGVDGTVRLWSVPSGHALGAALRHRGSLRTVEFSPDGKRVVTAGDDNTARIWDAKTGEPLSAPLRHNGSVHGATFLANGQQVLTIANDRTVRIWEAGTHFLAKQTAGPAPAPPDKNGAPSWVSPDGRHVVLLEGDCGVRLHDATTGEAIGPPMRHGSAILHAAFSPDGLRLVTSSDDNTARVWHAPTGELLAPPLEHGATVHLAEFSPDGRWLVSAAADLTARAWDARTGEPLTPPLPHSASVQSVAFTADSLGLILTNADGMIHEYDVRPDRRPSADLLELADLLAGSRVDGARGLLPLTPQQMHAAWQGLHTRYPQDFGPLKTPATAAR